MKPLTVHCGDCSHEWVAAWLPMTVDKLLRVAGKPHCPRCASENVLCGPTEEKAMPTEMRQGTHRITADPTRAELDDPRFEAIWQTIKKWNIATGCTYEGANGSHVAKILRALDADDTGMTPIEKAASQGIRNAQRLAHQTAVDAGWYHDPETGEPRERNFGEVISLMHSELSEAMEADRKGLKDDKLPHRDGREVEFADCIIRILDTAEALGLDVAGALIEKNRYNAQRQDHKPESRAQENGKRY